MLTSPSMSKMALVDAQVYPPRMENTDSYATDMDKGPTTAVQRRVELNRKMGLDSTERRGNPGKLTVGRPE
jgi:hypothetical protein